MHTFWTSAKNNISKIGLGQIHHLITIRNAVGWNLTFPVFVFREANLNLGLPNHCLSRGSSNFGMTYHKYQQLITVWLLKLTPLEQSQPIRMHENNRDWFDWLTLPLVSVAAL